MNRFRQGFHHSFFTFDEKGSYRGSDMAEKDDLLKWKEGEEDRVKTKTKEEVGKVEKEVRASQKEQDNPSYTAYLNSLDESEKAEHLRNYETILQQKRELFLETFDYVNSKDAEVSQSAIDDQKSKFYDKKGIIRFEGKEYKVEENYEELVDRLKELGGGRVIKENIKIKDCKTKPRLIDIDGADGRSPFFTSIDISYEGGEQTEYQGVAVEEQDNVSYTAYLNSLDESKKTERLREYEYLIHSRCEGFMLDLGYMNNEDVNVRQETVSYLSNFFNEKKGIIRFEGKEYKFEENFEEFIDRLKELGDGEIIIKNIKIEDCKTKPHYIDNGGGGVRAPFFTSIDISYKEGGQAGDQSVAVEETGYQDAVVEESDNVAPLYTDKNQNNISTGTERASDDKISKKIEKKEVEGDEKLQKELRKQLENLAKNKKIDFPWTNNEWKCSKEEKKLAISSAKVFIELLASSQNNGGNKVEEMLDMCRNYSGELDKDTAKKWKMDLGINSKEGDIQNFYKSFLEYQSRQSRFAHLQGLMGFFFENGIVDVDDLRFIMKYERSKKIDKKEMKEWKNQHKEEKGTRNKETRNEIARFEIIKERIKDDVDETEKMLALLCDFNFDGEVNSGDMGYRTGTQFAEIFRRELAMNEIKGNDAVKNLVDFANERGLNMEGVEDVESLYEWMTTGGYEQDADKNFSSGYDNTKKLQDLIQNSAADFSDILVYGKDAGKKTLDSMMRAEGIESAEAEKLQEEIDKKVKAIMEAEKKKLEELYPDAEQRSNIMKHLIDQLPAALIDKAKNVQKGMAVGARIPLDQIVKGMSVGFHVGIDTKNKKPIFGLFLGRDKTVDLGKGADLSVGANAGLNLCFIPCTSVSAEIGFDIKNGRRNKTLDATGVGRISLGGNAGIYGGMCTWGVSAGYENKKKAGIEKQEKNIHNVIESQAYDWVKELSEHENATEEDLKIMLKNKFGETSDDELNRATENLWRIVSTFKLNGNTTEEDKQIYAKVIADVFTDLWKNNAMMGITNNKWKRSGGKLGIQFFAGFVPVGSVVVKFTRYRNARTLESDDGRVRRIDAAVNGTGNEFITLENGEIGAAQVDALEKVLYGYGVQPYSIRYISREGKPGRVSIDKSIGKLIDVRISSDLKGYVQLDQSDGDFYLFPANTVYRLLTETGGNKKSAILNIGGAYNTESDIDITNESQMDELLGDGELTEGKRFPEGGKYEIIPVTYEESTVLELFGDTGVRDALKTIDSADWKAFSKFMGKKRDAEADFQSQIDALTGVLSKNPKLQPILEALKDTNRPTEEKQLIIDRVMAISAYANVVSKEILNNLINQRKERYKEAIMKGPNGKTIFDLLEKDYRSELQNMITDEDCKSEIMPDILGATAFYNRHNTEKGLAITGLGVTSVLGGKTLSLEGEDRQKACEWFLGGGEGMTGATTREKSPIERENLSSVVTKHINSSLEGDLITNLSERDLKALLRGEEVELTLDNSQEIIRIKLPVDFVFYLMAECGNESIGMKLGDLQILRQVDAYRKGQLYLNGVDGTSTIENEEANRAVGGSIGGGPKEEKEPNYDDGSNPSNGKPTTNPRHHEEGGGNGQGNGLNNNTGKRGGNGPDHNDDGNL